MAKDKILIVEDESIVGKDIKNTLEILGYEVSGIISTGEDAIEKAEEINPDLILMDIMLKGDIDGIEATKQITEKHNIPVIYLTAYSDENTLMKIQSTESYGYILKPFKEAELKTSIEMALHKHSEKFKNKETKKKAKTDRRYNWLIDSLLHTISTTIEMKTPFRKGDSEKVAGLATAIGKEIELSENQIMSVNIASYVHNIGMLYVPVEVLSKPAPLTENERNMIKSHPSNAYEILKEIEYPYPIAKIVIQHQERLDGSGYPQNLKGDDIIIEAQIIGLANTVQAMCSDRPYRKAYDIDYVLDEITKNKGILFNEKLVDACIRLFKEKDFSF
ncbi:MAG: HD-GYP domain-containing protein [Spirochaetota bacterium]